MQQRGRSELNLLTSNVDLIFTHRYCDRVNLSVAVISMADELEWDREQQAAVLAAFFYGYVCSQLIGAELARRHGFKPVLLCAVALWSLVTMTTPNVARISTAAAASWRVLLGLLEGVTYPTMYAAFSATIPLEERSTTLVSSVMHKALTTHRSRGKKMHVQRARPRTARNCSYE